MHVPLHVTFGENLMPLLSDTQLKLMKDKQENLKAQYYGIKEIARIANVSIGTVDRVIHNRPGVSEKTRDKVIGIIQEMDYQPNILASRLASRKMFTIAILIPDVSEETDFWVKPYAGIRRAAFELKQYGMNIENYFFDLNDKRSFVEQAQHILDRGVDGVLLAPLFREEAGSFAGKCLAQGIPFVFIDANITDIPGLCYIGPHLFSSGYQVAQLIDLCIRAEDKILVFNITREMDDHTIEDGFRAYFSERGNAGSIHSTTIRQTDFSSVERTLELAFREHPDLRSIFVPNSRVAAVARYLEKNDLTDLLVVGYDLTDENLKYLEKDFIQFLICHKPEEQGYKGVMAFYQSLVLGSRVDDVQFMPIDIITRNNYKFYHS